MSRTPSEWYAQIIAACDAAEELCGRGREAFDADHLLQRAAKNICLEVGEAAKQVEAQDPDELAATDYERWPLVIRMRDFYGHNYPVTDPEVLWTTLARDLPELRAVVASRLAEIDPR